MQHLFMFFTNMYIYPKHYVNGKLMVLHLRDIIFV